ncbi:MAG: SLBB domain-containing protein [Acidobacteriota bacterium]|nr:SLBB domain-containing protein [Acidobacteriota bacterium]
MLADSPQCTGQNAGTSNPMLPPQTQTAAPGQYGASSRGLNNNYSDTGPLSRQQPVQNQTLQVTLPPEPLTEFQKFVASTTGQILPIYGANLFRTVPSTFAPLDMTPVPSDFVLGPDDVLRIRVWGQVNFQANLRVDRSGEIYLPQIGPVHVAGLPFSELDSHLRSAVGRIYRNFDLTADVGQIRSIQIYVAGEARRPGAYTVSSLSTLVDAIFSSGGPSLQGSMRHIELRRGGAVVTDFDLYNLLIHGDKSKDAKLLPGDVIFIPPVGAQAAITGSVRSPAIYELRENEPLSDLLASAGGVSAVAAEARISIERIEGHQDRHAMEVAYDQSGLATPLANGDLVRVFSIVPIYRQTVILRGNIANPGRFAWHPGMKVSELIPDKESLVTRDYWWKRAQLGLPAPEFEPTRGFDNLRQPAENHAIKLSAAQQPGMMGPRQRGVQQNQPGMGPQQNQPGLDDQQNQIDSGSQMAPYGADAQQGQSSMEQQQDQNLSAQQRAGGSSLAAEQSTLSAGTPRPAQRTVVRQLAPEIDWNYAVIERLDKDTLKARLIPFDLGKLVLQHDASQDLELQAGDVVSIFSEADIRVPLAEQTKLVRLEGEFAHAGVYAVEPGESLRQLVERAGGLTPNAYLYGSEFSRESARRLQQARIDEYVQSLDMRIQRSNMALAASQTSSQGMAGGPAALANEQELMNRLRQIRATGRVVLEFKPGSTGVNSIPDIAMENGDRFVVPPVPATVNVVGAVYDQNTFLYARGKRAGAYLRQAGGPTKDADRKREFIIRADGKVISYDMGSGLWGNEFYNLPMNPGDTIVVPDKTFKPSILRGVADWSSVFSQFALGAVSLTLLP